MNSPRAPKCPAAGNAYGVPRKCQTQLQPLSPAILVVEDGSGLPAKIGALLRDQGLPVIMAPETASPLDLQSDSHILAVIAGATRNQPAALDLLAAVKNYWPGVKTLVVTPLDGPGFPLRAYEMELDDYLHWPLTAAELTGRIKDLLEPDALADLASAGPAADDYVQDRTLSAISSLVDRFTETLALIAQSLADLRQEYRHGLPPGLAVELASLAAQVQKLSDSLRQGWHFQADDTPDRAQSRRFH